mgnify:CR=1 FL=1
MRGRAFAGWVGNNPQTGEHNDSATPYNYPQQSARYIAEWVKGAKTVHDLDIDYVGIWNESPWDATYIKTLRQTLDDYNCTSTQIVAPDGGGLDLCQAMQTDPELAKVVDVIGLHYPTDFGPSYTDTCSTGRYGQCSCSCSCTGSLLNLWNCLFKNIYLLVVVLSFLLGALSRPSRLGI